MIKQSVKNCIRKIIILNIERGAYKTEKQVCKANPHWKKVSPEYMKYVRFGQSECAMRKIYNMADINKPSDMGRYVSNVLFKASFLPVLNYGNYTRIGNSVEYTPFDDKNYQPLFMSKIQSPKVVARILGGVFYSPDFRILDRSDFIKLLESHEQLVFKVAYGSGHGKGVSLVNKPDYAKKLNELKSENVIIQEVLKQHSSFAKWNPSSVNIVRILTLLWDGKVRVLGGYFRLGAPGGFCDHLMCGGESPLQIPLTEDGLFMNRCYDFDKGHIYSDVRGMKIEGGILKYDEMKQKACRAHEAYPFNRLIGWDMTLDENGEIVLIEYNPGCPEALSPQCSLGPIFDFKLDNGDNFIDTVVRLSKVKLG